MKKYFIGIKILVLLFLLAFLGIFIGNLDVAARAYQAYQSGTFNLQRLRFDIASFDLGKNMPVQPVKSKISPKDGMTQLFVPRGEFIMGRLGPADDNSPQHKVLLDAFWIDQVEVSNAMYQICERESGCDVLDPRLHPYYGRWIYRNYPIVYVNWYQAKKYCEWAGRRLPTEAEWEKAARGTDGQKYPWGNDDPNPRLANYSESMIAGVLPVYRYPLGASPYGALNMAGNVREWVTDWYSTSYYSESAYYEPTGPESGFERSMRSGSFDEDAREIMVTTRYKHEPQSPGINRGFRCVQPADEQED